MSMCGAPLGRHKVHRASPVQTEVLEPNSGAISGGCAVLCVVMGIGRVYVYVWGVVRGDTKYTARRRSKPKF